MADNKPEFDEGFLGPQVPTFGEMGLGLKSHESPEIKINDNQLDIKLKMDKPLKFTHKLIDCKDDKEYNDLVFTHTRNKEAAFFIQFPAKGWYQFQLYALPLQDAGRNLPNVINYLIFVKSCLNLVFPFPKQYVQWRDGCFLEEPKFLHKDLRLSKINWKVYVPKANAVLVAAGEEFFTLDKKDDDLFETTISLHKYRSSGAKVTLNANFDKEDDKKYSVLLEYKI